VPEKLRVALVGLAFGRHMIEHQILAGPGAEYLELAGVCARTPATVHEAAERYGVKPYVGIDAALADESVEAVVLMTGPVGRADQIRQIIRAGRHVMTTKPFELDSAEAASVLEEARALGRVVHLNSPCPTRTDDLRQMAAWQEKYDLGRPLAARHECWYKSVEKADGSWYDDPELCPVAPIFRLGIYGINDLLLLFGTPQAVQVTESRLLTGRPTPDLAQLTIHFETGAIASTLDGWCLQPPRDADSLVIYYENGTIFRNPPVLPGDPEHEQCRLCVIPAGRKDGTPAEQVTLRRHQLSHCYLWDVFCDAVRGRPPRDETPDRVIVDGVRVIEAMRRAARSGCREPVSTGDAPASS
jgi:predicted dehydrogenase